MGKTANIDADILIYSVGSFTNPHPFLKDSEGKPLEMPCSTEAIQGLLMDEVNKIVEGAGCDSYRLFVSSSTNFRDKVAVTYPYKGRRSEADKPYHYQTVKDYILEELTDVTTVSDNREADDELADAQTKDTILCSLDKDLDMVAGWHYNWRKGNLYHVSYEEGYHKFMHQLLTGDWGTDSILGCGKLVNKVYGPKAQKAGQQYQQREGVGPKEADKILSVPTSNKLDQVVAAYQRTFGDEWEQKLNEMATLLFMGGTEDNQWRYNERKEDYRKPRLGCCGTESTRSNYEETF